MLITVKSREIQRAMLAEMRGDRCASDKHFLAAAHLELVLAEDYQHIGEPDLALRSRLSAASCFWRGGKTAESRKILEDISATAPDHAGEAQNVLQELERDHPPSRT
jgi:hypothetical protein